jgi:hypothetical protein
MGYQQKPHTVTFTETTYACGHQSSSGGTVADPAGLSVKVRFYRESDEKCSVCKNPEKYPRSDGGFGFAKQSK